MIHEADFWPVNENYTIIQSENTIEKTAIRPGTGASDFAELILKKCFASVALNKSL